MTTRRGRRAAIFGGAGAIVVAGGVAGFFALREAPAPRQAGDVFVVKKNGGWCWFQDERVLVDGGKLVVGTVAGVTRDGADAGDVEVSTFDLASRATTTAKLHAALQSDDHASPALLTLPDGRYLSAYTKHGADSLMRWRVSERPGDATSWTPEETLDVRGQATYSNLAVDRERGLILNFFRGGENAARIASSPFGGRFALAGRVFSWSRSARSFDPAKSTRPSPSKPYVRYAARGDVIHLVTTEDHPRAYDNSVYHGYIRGSALYDSFGAVIDDDLQRGPAPELTRLTRVYEGNRDNVAWTLDVDVDDRGLPYVAFVVQKDGQGRSSKSDLGGDDHRYHLARFDGEGWRDVEAAYAGHGLYRHEVNYTGLVALVPRNPDVVFMSADVHPETGEPLADPRRWELFRGATHDHGATWKWRRLTEGSTADNIRPVVPVWDGGTVVVWLRGAYGSMNSYDLDVVGMLDPGP